MTYRNFRVLILFLALNLTGFCLYGQTGVPAGIHYQAVARDNYGKELANAEIDVRFSVISQNPLGPVVFQELHSHVITSKYGVFSLIIGRGVQTGGIYSDLSQVSWSESYHYLKVEVKFESSFVDMGTMQFMAVPYALFAWKALEPGPAGEKGDTGPEGPQGLKGEPGDPATDDQTLSVVNVDGADYLAISGGNQVKISNIERDGDPANEIQDLSINADKLKITKNASAQEWDLSPYRQSLTYDPSTRIIGISGTSSTVNLSELENDDDASSTNELQALSFNSSTNILSLTNSASADLTSLKDDADASVTNEIQSLSLSGDVLAISGSNNVNLTGYKDNTDNQTLTYTEEANFKTLQIAGGNTVTLDNMVAFRSQKVTEETGLTLGTDYVVNYPIVDYNDGSGYKSTTGIFTAPSTGIYTFIIGYNAGTSGNYKTLKIKVNSDIYEILDSDISINTSLTRSITLKLVEGDLVSAIINVGVSVSGGPIGTGTGSFSGFRVY